MALPRPPVDDDRRGFCATIDQRPGIVRIAQHLMDAMLTGQAPADVSAPSPRADLRQWYLCITIPQHGLSGTAQFPKLLENAGDGVLHLAVGDLFDAIVTRAYESHGDFPHDMAPWDFGFKGLARPLAHEPQLLFRHRALHPQD
jgi:hypothetical protein